ncbi:hypothetical protein KFL_002680040 [Klebsormidium nitens]|uniref:Peptidoglycan binding-like domain-containing protein n=1 Tax=Klebsormidium nitens TaxID=105231 RepID=A0A1Y1IDA0_KLENI|nr:hypothetical protein KFL_002680040 [Klebsormidium nitens]|eukprot:GAQ86058.1 hypothetical protein KFL_002680040 [Klebsormidium nitens]
MAKALAVRTAQAVGPLSTKQINQHSSLQGSLFGSQGNGKTLRTILSLKTGSTRLFRAQKCFHCRSFHPYNTEASHSRWRNVPGLASRPDYSRTGPTFHRGFPSVPSGQRHEREGRRRAQHGRARAAASDETDSRETLLPRAVLAELRQKGVTIWEFYYDTSAEAYGVGDFGEEVRALQGYLMTTGDFRSEHGATGYFGPETQKALSNWQRQHGVEPALGVWGPFSRDKYRQLVAQDASRRGLQRKLSKKPAVIAADRPGPSPPSAVGEASRSPSSASVSVPLSPPAASHARGGLSLAQSLVAAFAIVGVAVLGGFLLQRNKASRKDISDAQELDRARNMLEMDRTGGPQPGEREAGRHKAAPEER